MENLIPPLWLAIREIRWNIENNNSVRESIKKYSSCSPDSLARDLCTWLLHKQTTEKRADVEFKTPHQKALISILERGLNGQPILESLHELEVEVQRAALLELDMHVARLPFLSMIPLFAFQFPAYLLLLLGPLLTSLLKEFAQ